MSHYGNHPPLRTATDPADLVWNWFILNGPHGENFSWPTELPHRQSNIQLLARFIQENTATNPNFTRRAREVALEALEMTDVVLIRKAIQVLTVVGSDDDLERIRAFTNHSNKKVAADARCALFERRIK